MKRINIRFDDDAEKAYQEVKFAVVKDRKRQNPTYKQILVSIDDAKDNLAFDPYYGNQIPRKYLNKKIINFYGVDKIFRVELVGYWRLLYTIITDESLIVVLILDFMDHNRYNKLFGYKKR